jgi:hypothetical protein
MSELEGPRLLSIDMDGSTIVTDTELNPITYTGEGWELVGNHVVNRKYFDLSGYVVEDLTLFAQSIVVQEGHPVFGTANAGLIIDLVTTEFVSNAEITRTLSVLPSQFGFALSTLDMNQILYGMMRKYTQKSTITPIIPNLHSVNNWGTGNSTAGSKLYITRIAECQEAERDLIIPQSNWVVAAMIIQEKELPYIQRVIRSNEHTAVQ